VDAGWSVGQIAAHVGRSASTVSREIHRNKWVLLNQNELDWFCSVLEARMERDEWEVFTRDARVCAQDA